VVKVTYVEQTGGEHLVEVPLGLSLMQGAVDTGTPGIVGECGGQMACGACHVYLDEPWLTLSGTRSTFEAGMLALSDNTRENSRLACQIKASGALDGIIVHMPASQP
jgi:2Fe-2S ferredoxin